MLCKNCPYCYRDEGRGCCSCQFERTEEEPLAPCEVYDCPEDDDSPSDYN